MKAAFELLIVLTAFSVVLGNVAEYEYLCDIVKRNTKIRLPNSSNQYIMCGDNGAQVFSCEGNSIYDAKQEKCIETGVRNLCDLVGDNTMFRSVDNCSQGIKCENDKLETVDCGTRYFNVETGECVKKSTITCNFHPATSKTCLKNNKPYIGNTTDNFTCRGFFVCADKGDKHDLQPNWQQCPEGLFFDETIQDCLLALDVKCKHNRCEGRGNSKVVSGRNNCRNYLQCANNVVLSEAKCEKNHFFDEVLQKCVGGYYIRDKACSK